MTHPARATPQPKIDETADTTESSPRHKLEASEKDLLLHKIVRLSHKLPEPELPLAVALIECIVEHHKLRRAA